MTYLSWTEYVLPPLRDQLPDRVLHDPDTIVDPISDSEVTNGTDYTFPRWWGLLLKRAEDDKDPLTHEEVYERRNEWFVEQREKKQLKRQYDAGMFNYLDELDEGIPFGEAIARVENNDYKIK